MIGYAALRLIGHACRMATALVYDEIGMSASFRHPGDAADIYRIWIDGPVLRVLARGYWSLAAAQRYGGDIARIVTELRRTQPQLRAIVDRSDTPAMEAGVHELLMASYHDVLRAGDRIALVVDSSLAKVRIRQLAGREETQAFLSISAARTWLLAYD